MTHSDKNYTVTASAFTDSTTNTGESVGVIRMIVKHDRIPGSASWEYNITYSFR